LRRLHDDVRVTSVFVTHDQEEALEISDRVVVMRAGTIDSIPVTVEHVAARGAVVRVELAVAGGGGDYARIRMIEADLTHACVRELALAKGQRVFARSTALRTFTSQAAE
jgi:ABC-type sulfate/molybdate transport systems ATPase subunit